MNISMTPYGSQNSWGSVHSSVSTPYTRINSQDITSKPADIKLSKNNNSDSKNEIKSEEKNKSEDQASQKAENDYKLTENELRIVEELKKTDTAVRRHEMAHIAAGGQYITSGARLEYQKGPDGKNYAVAGEVSIDTSPVPGDPEATAKKMRIVQQAAMAPVDPSPQDRTVAAKASALAMKAASELVAMRAEERASSDENQALGNYKNGAETYAKVQNPNPATGTFLNIAA